jgi:plasmid stabilization system protein ParE
MFLLQISQPAEQDILEAFQWWSLHRSTDQAQRWYQEIYNAINSLCMEALRCQHAPESDLHPSGLRQLHFGIGRRPTHRVVFAIDDNTVTIIRVRHTSQDSLIESDLT